jgi:DNA-binding LacI/PurR family transcriptional regulator
VWRDEFTFAAGATAAAAIAARTTRPTALLCSKDLVAIAAIDGARSAGLGVPGSLSIVGFDDIEMARRTAELLMTRIRQPDIGRRRVVLRPALAERTSHRDIAPS